MNHSDDELRQATALFRYGVIADLVHLPVGTPGLIARMRDKAAQTYAIPGTTRTRVAANTIRDWIKLYRDGGFEALYPKPRADRGQPRRMPPEVATRLIALKLANPTWSVRTVIRAARDAGIDYPLASSTVHRLFHREGLCCFPLYLVGSPRDLTGLFRRRISWDDGVIRDTSDRGEVAFVMNDCCRSGGDGVARAASVGKGWASAAHLSMPCPHGP